MLEEKEPNYDTCIIAVEMQVKNVGFVVDRVGDIVEIKKAEIIKVEELNT